MRRFTALLLPLLLAGCGAPNIIRFKVNSIKVDGQRHPCQVIIDQQDQLDPIGEPLITPCEVALNFSEKREYELAVRALAVDPTNGSQKILMATEPQPFVDREREITQWMPSDQLFILTKNPNY
jgi:hypothetical protein